MVGWNLHRIPGASSRYVRNNAVNEVKYEYPNAKKIKNNDREACIYRTYETITSKRIKEEGDLMSKVLVAYFSASGVTKRVAGNLANAAGADLFEIVPEQIYTSADLNWQDKQSRSSVEMNDRSARPAISSKIEDIKQYSHVFVGFPVWWYREPSIIDTFMESYDWDGVTVIPFCTSGGSGLGDAGENMQTLGKGAKVIDGKRLSGSASETELKTWIEQIL